MMLAVDVGNTQICLGVFQGRKLIRQFRLATRPKATASELKQVMAARLKTVRPQTDWEGVAVASVVPGINSRLQLVLRELTQAKLLMIRPEMPLPVKNCYHPPRAVGADRLINAVAGIHEFRSPLLIVDFGTATTIDAVASNGIYLGGAILPGPGLSAQALAQGTALLPRIKVRKVKHPLGRNTRQSLLAGIVLGAAGAVEKLVRLMKKELGPRTRVVATGGFCQIIAPYCPVIQYVRPHLTLEGLRLAWEYTRARR